MFICDGISDHAGWNEGLHHWDTKLMTHMMYPLLYLLFPDVPGMVFPVTFQRILISFLLTLVFVIFSMGKILRDK